LAKLVILCLQFQLELPFGLTHSSNRLLSASLSHYAGTSLGACEGPQCWSQWKGRCGSCRRLLVDGGGVFCANFSSPRAHWPPCQQAWCGKCYTLLDSGEFKVAVPKDADGIVVIENKDKMRYLEARDGDHLVTPFQCETCHARNLLGRDPQLNLASDVRLVKLIRRANLDAFWSSEPKTVEATLREARRGLRIASSLGFRDKLFTP
jgi:hypothetical protein